MVNRSSEKLSNGPTNAKARSINPEKVKINKRFILYSDIDINLIEPIIYPTKIIRKKNACGVEKFHEIKKS
tara:strand:+ start:411 stop:623 length:213 start_codon:yes stop_codon:yes gene_type:complete